MPRTRKLRGSGHGINAADGSSVLITLETDDGRLTLECAPETMMNVARHMSHVAGNAIDMRRRLTGKVSANAINVTSISVGAASSKPVVIVRVHGTEDYVEAFALSPDEAEKAAMQITAAVGTVREKRKGTLQ